MKLRNKRRAVSARALAAASGATVLALVLAAGPAHAQQWPTDDPSYGVPDPSLKLRPEGFGSPGTMVITGDFDLDFRHITDSFMGRSASATVVTVTPSVLVFMAQNFAVGGLLSLQYLSADPVSETNLSIGPLVAYNIPVGARTSIFPALGVTYTWGNRTRSIEGGSEDLSGYDISLLIKAPVLFHPFEHVFVGFGPFIELDLVAKQEGADTSKTRTLGLTLDLGFWL